MKKQKEEGSRTVGKGKNIPKPYIYPTFILDNFKL